MTTLPRWTHETTIDGEAFEAVGGKARLGAEGREGSLTSTNIPTSQHHPPTGLGNLEGGGETNAGVGAGDEACLQSVLRTAKRLQSASCVTDQPVNPKYEGLTTRSSRSDGDPKSTDGPLEPPACAAQSVGDEAAKDPSIDGAD